MAREQSPLTRTNPLCSLSGMSHQPYHRRVSRDRDHQSDLGPAISQSKQERDDWPIWQGGAQAPRRNAETPSSSTHVGGTEANVARTHVWETGTGASNYSAVYGAESPTKADGGKKPRLGGLRSSTSRNTSHRLKGRNFEYAFIGKEAEQYVQEALRPQIDSAQAMPSLSSRDSVAPSPTAASTLTPQTVIESFRRAGHFETARKELLSTFQSSEHKEALLDALQSHLLKMMAQLTPDARQKLASQDSRLQELEVNRWVEENSDASDIVDEVFRKLRAEREDHTGWFQKEGVVGRSIETNLLDVIANEKQSRDQKKGESSDEDDTQTPQHKGDSTPAQDSFSRGSHTPRSLAAAEWTPESRDTTVP